MRLSLASKTAVFGRKSAAAANLPAGDVLPKETDYFPGTATSRTPQPSAHRRTESAAAGGGRFAVHGLGGDVAKDIDHLHAGFLKPAVDFTFEAAYFGFNTFENLNLLHEVTPDSFSPDRKGR